MRSNLLVNVPKSAQIVRGQSLLSEAWKEDEDEHRPSTLRSKRGAKDLIKREIMRPALDRRGNIRSEFAYSGAMEER